MPVSGPLSTAVEAGEELTSQAHYAILRHLVQVLIPTGSLLMDVQPGFKGRKEKEVKQFYSFQWTEVGLKALFL